MCERNNKRKWSSLLSLYWISTLICTVLIWYNLLNDKSHEKSFPFRYTSFKFNYIHINYGIVGIHEWFHFKTCLYYESLKLIGLNRNDCHFPFMTDNRWILNMCSAIKDLISFQTQTVQLSTSIHLIIYYKIWHSLFEDSKYAWHQSNICSKLIPPWANCKHGKACQHSREQLVSSNFV